MRPRDDPRRWPICSAIAVALVLGAVFLIPAAWFEALFSPLGDLAARKAASDVQPIVLLPVEVIPLKPEIEAVEDEPEDRQRPTPRREEAAWWRSVWQVHLRQRSAVALRGTPPDSELAVKLELLGGLTDPLQWVEPDSATADLLTRLYLADGFRLEDGLKTFLWAQGIALDYLDLRSREADMFDEHLMRSIPVTDLLADKLRREDDRR